MAWVQIAAATLSGNSPNCSHPLCLCSPSSKIGSSPLKGCEVTADLAESNGSLPPGLWLTSPAGWLQRTGISSGTLRSAVEYLLPLLFYWWIQSFGVFSVWPMFVFSSVSISQGSVVTCSTWNGVINDQYTKQSQSVNEKNCKSVYFWQSYRLKYSGTF